MRVRAGRNALRFEAGWGNPNLEAVTVGTSHRHHEFIDLPNGRCLVCCPRMRERSAPCQAQQLTEDRRSTDRHA
jgi:hypothetical protein